MWFIESRAWSTVMTAESDYSLTVNRPHKQIWERFFPEVPNAVNDPKVEEFVSLKTYWDTYLKTSSTGIVDANGASSSVETYL